MLVHASLSASCEEDRKRKRVGGKARMINKGNAAGAGRNGNRLCMALSYVRSVSAKAAKCLNAL